MAPRIANFYRTHFPRILFIAICAAALSYFAVIVAGGGDDLMMRIAEAKYFIRHVNPYDVFNGTVPRDEALGRSAAYSFFSYYFAAALTLLGDPRLQTLAFAAIDVVLLVAGIRMAERLFGQSKSFWAPVVMGLLLGSVFFWQHLFHQNYNLIAAFGLILTFWSIQQNYRSRAVLGIVILGVKPTLAIPTLIYLVVTRRWAILVRVFGVYAVALLGAAYWVNQNPILLVLQLAETEIRISGDYTDGIFYFLKPGLIGNNMTIVGVVICFLMLGIFRKRLTDPANGLMAVAVLGISVFYNHVHAYVIAYPLLVCALIHSRMSAMPLVLLTAFLVVPRLAGEFAGESRDVYVAGHNVIRFGLLYLACLSLIRIRSAVSAPDSVLDGQRARLASGLQASFESDVTISGVSSQSVPEEVSKRRANVSNF